MWKNMIFWLWKVQQRTSSLNREMESPSKQVSWGEETFSITTRFFFCVVLNYFGANIVLKTSIMSAKYSSTICT
jgi:hypothetical protein